MRMGVTTEKACMKLTENSSLKSDVRIQPMERFIFLEPDKKSA